MRDVLLETKRQTNINTAKYKPGRADRMRRVNRERRRSCTEPEQQQQLQQRRRQEEEWRAEGRCSEEPFNNDDGDGDGDGDSEGEGDEEEDMELGSDLPVESEAAAASIELELKAISQCCENERCPRVSRTATSTTNSSPSSTALVNSLPRARLGGSLCLTRTHLLIAEVLLLLLRPHHRNTVSVVAKQRGTPLIWFTCCHELLCTIPPCEWRELLSALMPKKRASGSGSSATSITMASGGAAAAAGGSSASSVHRWRAKTFLAALRRPLAPQVLERAQTALGEEVLIRS
jgi:hypothetical protein